MWRIFKAKITQSGWNIVLMALFYYLLLDKLISEE
jgi:hypothetical protein